MNILILDLPVDSRDGTVTVPRTRLAEMIDRRNLQIGNQLTVGIINGAVGCATIERIEHDLVTLAYHCDAASPQPLALECVIAIPRPQILKRLWRDAAMLGIEQLSLVRSALTDKNYLKSHMLQQQTIDEQIRLGLEQSVATIPPRVSIYESWTRFSSSWSGTSELKLLACPSGNSDWTDILRQGTVTDESPSRTVLAIGPERGWTESERAWFVDRGFAVVNVSPRVLRVDVAVSYLCGMLVGMRSKLENEKAG